MSDFGTDSAEIVCGNDHELQNKIVIYQKNGTEQEQ